MLQRNLTEPRRLLSRLLLQMTSTQQGRYGCFQVVLQSFLALEKVQMIQ
jgi:hypothetical protein